MPYLSNSTKSGGRPPVILLDGLSNTVALCRSFGREGIEVIVCGPRKCPAHYSRFCTKSIFPLKNETNADFWTRVLITAPHHSLLGNVIFPCNDEAIDFVARNKKTLSDNFILEINPSSVRLALLNKRESINIAERAGISVPRLKMVTNEDEVQASLEEWQLPMLIRPIYSHEFTRVFGQKLILCDSTHQVESMTSKAFSAGVSIMLCEYVPGPDDRLCSYFTYIDDSGKPLFAFTKRVLRRHPYNFGEGTYHITKWLPEVAKLGQKFLTEAGLRGLGNVEFKRDPRDGQLKFIECNARFTANHELFVKSGFDIGHFVYGQLTGFPYELPETFAEGVRMSFTFRDFKEYWHLSKKGKLTFSTWIQETIAAQARPYFQWSDPLPVFCRIANSYRQLLFSVQRLFARNIGKKTRLSTPSQ